MLTVVLQNERLRRGSADMQIHDCSPSKNWAVDVDELEAFGTVCCCTVKWKIQYLINTIDGKNAIKKN